jgi:hypothetical protein
VSDGRWKLYEEFRKYCNTAVGNLFMWVLETFGKALQNASTDFHSKSFLELKTSGKIVDVFIKVKNKSSIHFKAN